MSKAKTIDLQTFHQAYQSLGANDIILDVRSEEEWNLFRIPGSINIPHDQISTRAEELKKYAKIYIHCKMGGRAQQAFQALMQLGFQNVFCLTDAGIQDWYDEGFPLEN